MKSVFKALKLGSVRPEGWLAEHLDRELKGFTGHLDELTSRCGNGIFFKREAEKDVDQQWWSYWWEGESEGNWMEGLVQSAWLARPNPFWEKCEAFVKKLLESQDDDGYIGIYKKEKRWKKAEEGYGELWTQSRALLILLNYYDLTGKREALDAVIRAVRLTMDMYRKMEKCLDGSESDHGIMYIDVLYRLREITGETSYAGFAEYLYLNYSRNNSGSNLDTRYELLGKRDVPFLGHGAHTCEGLRLPALLYSLTGKEEYREAFALAVEKMKDCSCVTGTCRSDERVGLPLPGAGIEYCCITEQCLSLMAGYRITGDNSCADWAELIMYNQAQAQRRKDGKSIAYLHAENSTRADGTPHQKWGFSPTHERSAVCCVPNAGRITPYFTRNLMVTEGDSTVALAFYAPCKAGLTLGGGDVTITVDTVYPFEDEVRVKVDVAVPLCFTLKLRIPGWACTASASHGAVRKGDYFVVNKTWQGGEEIVLSLGAKIELLEAVNQRIAVKRGPLFYVLKIEEEGRELHSYPLEGFHDINFTPKPGQNWDYSLVTDPQALEKIFTFERECPKGAYPWEKPNQKIRALLADFRGRLESKELLPMGCTTLRVAVFEGIRRAFDYCRLFNEDRAEPAIELLKKEGRL
jgi:hypothetical protein